MLNSLFSGVSGLQSNQEMMDVVGNNLANSNTTGFKTQQVTFQDIFYQTLSQATNPASSNSSGTNPVQVGAGVKVGSVNALMTQGNIQATGRNLDVALQGSGFLVARNGNQNLYTRAGSLSVDNNNFLIDPSTGYRLQRYGTVGDGANGTQAFQVSADNDISIPVGTTVPGKTTSVITMQGNLSTSATGPMAQVLTTAQPYKSGGVAATGATLLNGLDDNAAQYIAGDQIKLQGIDANGQAVNVNVAVDNTTTMTDIVTAINTNFAGSTAALDATGNITITANVAGPSNLSVTITDLGTNTGSMNWANHGEVVTTIGKAADTVQTSIQAYDSAGSPHTISLTYTKQANGNWNLAATMNPADGTLLDGSVAGITFNQNGSFRQVSGTGVGDPYITVQFAGQATTQTIGFNFGTIGGFDGLTAVGGGSSASATNQNGYAAGTLSTLSFGQDGIITGNFSNGRSLAIAQVAVATFANQDALDRIGQNYYTVNNQSGLAQIGAAGTAGRASIQQQALESSNVDIAREFTNLIIAQRGYQVDAKVITASNEILQTLTQIIQ